MTREMGEGVVGTRIEVKACNHNWAFLKFSRNVFRVKVAVYKCARCGVKKRELR